MAELNRAYARPARRATAGRPTTAAVGPRSPASRSPRPCRRARRAPPDGRPPAASLGFGRYAGWSLRDLARQDPDYLLWLSRHSSGIRYRTEIYGILRTMGVSAA